MFNSEVDVVALQQRVQTQFIERRTIAESEANKFLESLKGMDADIKERINYDPNKTARTELSALWEEPFSETKYNEQKARFDSYVAYVAAICDALNAEASRCLQEY